MNLGGVIQRADRMDGRLEIIIRLHRRFQNSFQMDY